MNLLFGVIFCCLFAFNGILAETEESDDALVVEALKVEPRRKAKQIRPAWASQTGGESFRATSFSEDGSYWNSNNQNPVNSYAANGGTPPWNYGNQPTGQQGPVGGQQGNQQQSSGYYPPTGGQNQNQGSQTQYPQYPGSGIVPSQSGHMNSTYPGETAYPQQPHPGSAQPGHPQGSHMGTSQTGHPQMPHPQQPHPGSGQSGYPTQPGYPQGSQTGTSQTGHPQMPQTGHPQQPHPGSGQPGYPGRPGHPQMPQTGHPQQPHPGSGQPGYPGVPGHPQMPQTGHPQQPHPGSGQPGYPGQPGHPQMPQTGHPQQPHPGSGQPGYPGRPGHPQMPQTGHPQQPHPGSGQPGYPGVPGHPQGTLQPGRPQRPQPGHPGQPQPGYPQQPYPGSEGQTFQPAFPPGSQPPLPQRPPSNEVVPGSPFYPQIQPGLTDEDLQNQLSQYCRASRGQFALETACNKYVNCWDGMAVEQECGGNLLFNEEKKYCDFPENVNCNGRPHVQTPPSIDGGCSSPFATYRSPTNCGEFFVCSHGTPNRFVCPAGLAYSTDLGVCDYPYRVECNGVPVLPVEDMLENPDQQGNYENTGNENYYGSSDNSGNKYYGQKKIVSDEDIEKDSIEISA